MAWKLRHKIAVGTARGQHYLHKGCQRRIIHRDIKAFNIPLTTNFEPQISDFGLARWLPSEWTHRAIAPIEGTFGLIIRCLTPKICQPSSTKVRDTSHPMLKRLGVKAFPAVLGRLANGDEHVLREGLAVKDLKTGINELRALLEIFEKKNKKVASSHGKKTSKEDPQAKTIPYLTSSNMDNVCSDKTAVCIIGIFRSSNTKEKLEAILSEVSRKTLVR